MTTSQPMTWRPVHRLEACDATQSVEHRGRAFESARVSQIRLPALRTSKNERASNAGIMVRCLEYVSCSGCG
jgi:hypothetical protein